MAILGGINENEIESGYFGEVPSDNPLVRMGVIDEPTPEPIGIGKVFAREKGEREKEAADPSIFDRFGETLSKRNEAGTDIIERGLEGKTGAIEGGVLVGANFLGTLADLTGDAITEAFTEFTPESFQESLMSGVKTLAETSGGEAVVGKLQEASKNLEDLKRLDPVKGARFQGGLDTINGMLELAGLGQAKSVKGAIKTGAELGTQAVRKSAVKAVDAITEAGSKIKLPTKAIDELPIDMRTQKGFINGVEVEIPVVNRSLTEKVVSPFTSDVTNKTLAGKAVSPRTIGKNRKQKLESIAEVETRTQNYYNNIRTGVLEGDIGTLEGAAQSMVSNLDTVGSRIGNAVSKVDGTIDFDKELMDQILTASTSKGSKVSPATSILNNFIEELGDGPLSIADAYSLKKGYSNEVTKLVKGGDAGTDQYKALADGVSFLNKKIDEMIETKLGDEFANDKKLYRDLLLLADDMVASSLVDGRRSANTLAERIGMLESITSPIASTKKKLIAATEAVNTRGGAWEELIKRYDEFAISNK